MTLDLWRERAVARYPQLDNFRQHLTGSSEQEVMQSAVALALEIRPKRASELPWDAAPERENYR
jgi:hypothetical protein